MNTTGMMRDTLVALIPGAVMYIWVFGIGILINLVATALAALFVEALMLKSRGQSLNHLRDCSALATAVLLALCLPPFLPIWQAALGVTFALVFGKHIYGGLGKNLFNPAMVGFAVLILAFPLTMTQWPAPDSAQDASSVFASKLVIQGERPEYDGRTGATPLDSYKFRSGLTNSEFFDEENTRHWQAWFQINVAFLLGGLFLIYRGIVGWQIPASFLGSLLLLALLFYDNGSSTSLGSPALHLFTGGTMLAAFFILTDPVTSPARKDLLRAYGAAIAIITYIIRVAGAYPEGIAFSVLLLNACVPLMDHIRTVSGQQP